mmetsp:Transcript_11325/g.14709  ORF Transcript_11325/g.14709 Transcript_11325/m.14709 type:complete len:84 (-) Transcript_11325:408-659(-)
MQTTLSTKWPINQTLHKKDQLKHTVFSPHIEDEKMHEGGNVDEGNDLFVMEIDLSSYQELRSHWVLLKYQLYFLLLSHHLKDG